jgi:hypothetical protein
VYSFTPCKSLLNTRSALYLLQTEDGILRTIAASLSVNDAGWIIWNLFWIVGLSSGSAIDNS